MPIIVGIDGTGTGAHDLSSLTGGEGDDAAYAADFKNSFVRRICWKPNPNKLYLRGPVDYGGGLMGSIDKGFYFILGRLEAAKNDKSILLTGYSRGGAGVIAIAQMLNRANIPVEAMLLFDAVDRHIGIDAAAIPKNVADVLHVRRSLDSKSRQSFGNCGLQHSPQTTYDQQFFRCTHGGMGGTPWKVGNKSQHYTNIKEGFPENFWTSQTNITYEADAEISTQVWMSVQYFINKHHFM